MNSNFSRIITTSFFGLLIPLTVNGQAIDEGQNEAPEPVTKGSRVFQEGNTVIKEIGQEELETSENYWIPERRRKAKPMPFRHGKGKAFPPRLLKTTPSSPPIEIPPTRGPQSFPPRIFNQSTDFGLSSGKILFSAATFNKVSVFRQLLASSLPSTDQPITFLIAQNSSLHEFNRYELSEPYTSYPYSTVGKLF